MTAATRGGMGDKYEKPLWIPASRKRSRHTSESRQRSEGAVLGPAEDASLREEITNRVASLLFGDESGESFTALQKCRPGEDTEKDMTSDPPVARSGPEEAELEEGEVAPDYKAPPQEHMPPPTTLPTVACKMDEILESQRQLQETVSYIVKLVTILRDRNIPLFERIVCRCGVGLCSEVLSETQKQMKVGGSPKVTLDGSRQRTPGGVFIRVLKSRISKEDTKFIWKKQDKSQAAFKKLQARDNTLLDKIIRHVASCQARLSTKHLEPQSKRSRAAEAADDIDL